MNECWWIMIWFEWRYDMLILLLPLLLLLMMMMTIELVWYGIKWYGINVEVVKVVVLVVVWFWLQRWQNEWMNEWYSKVATITWDIRSWLLPINEWMNECMHCCNYCYIWSLSYSLLYHDDIESKMMMRCMNIHKYVGPILWFHPNVVVGLLSKINYIFIFIYFYIVYINLGMWFILVSIGRHVKCIVFKARWKELFHILIQHCIWTCHLRCYIRNKQDVGW